MARGQIAKPEFFVDYFLWLNTVGSLDYNDIEFDNAFGINIGDEASGRLMQTGVPLISSMLRLDPSVANAIPVIDADNVDYSESISSFTVPTGLKTGYYDALGSEYAEDEIEKEDFKNFNINYVAFLNHNFSRADCFPFISFPSSQEDGEVYVPSLSEIINFRDDGNDGGGYSPLNDGYSIASFEEGNVPQDNIEKLTVSLQPSAGEQNIKTGLFLGGISIGYKYQPPSSPDMKITMTYEVGYKRKNTINGRKIAHLNWFRERGWSQFGIKRNSFNVENQLGLGHRFNFRKAGRRVWDISFSYLSEDNMFPTNINTTIDGMDDNFGSGTSETLTDNDINIIDESRTLMGDNSLIAQLLHKTCFGYLPFMFRPDSTYSKADAFCIAMLDMKKFTIRQVAHKLWSVKMRVTEVI